MLLVSHSGVVINIYLLTGMRQTRKNICETLECVDNQDHL